MKKFILLFLSLTIVTSLSFAQKYKIKFASLAPEGSTWMNVMKELDQEIRKQTNGDVGFRLYPGGVAGDEKDVLRKIRMGQLHSAGFTGVGLGEILPEVRIFDSPFLFRNYNEVDFIQNKFFDKFARGFEKEGYILLGWADVGFVYVYSNNPVNKLADMKNVKMWMWEGDLVAESTFKALGISPIPLSVIDVMTALQTGMVDGVYTSPLAAIALQWFTKTKYMMEFSLADAAGAVLISKKMFKKLPEDYQKILLETSKSYLEKLMLLSREENQKSIKALKDQGIQIVASPPADQMKQFYEAGKKARRMMVPRLYPLSLVEEVEQALDKFRAANER
ncbi:ABC transporter substrate-binding protein [candidate division KSB1 bacterium 4572_119]|nr:MAG: ABC transporter substrate-binding protein [candidate division KSB1 bacterium 4572_119]